MASTLVASLPVMAHPMQRWFWLKSWVTAPAHISTTSVIAPGLGMSMDKAAPKAIAAGAAVIVGRGLKK